MSNTVLAIIGWGLFYWVVFLYIFWVVVERTFFAGSDPERWEPSRLAETSEASGDDPEPILRFPCISTFGRPV
jgi:hypothetical protein